MSHSQRLTERIERRDPVSVRMLVSLLETHHPSEDPGIDRETLPEYADEADAALLVDGETTPLDGETVRRELDESVVESDAWVDADSVYRVGDGRVSAYPAAWHDDLRGTDDPEEVLAYLHEEAVGFVADVGTEAGGVPRELLLNVVAAVGDTDRDEAESNLRESKDDGAVVEADDGALTLPTDADDRQREGSLPPVLDIRDALADIEASADADVGDELARVRELLDELESRDRSGRESSLVDDIDNRVSALRERLSGDAERRATSIENRLGTYRDADAETTLTFADGALRDTDGDRVDPTEVEPGSVTLSGTVVNGGDRRQVEVVVTVANDAGDRVREVRFGPYGVDAGERLAVDETLFLPADAADSEVRAVATAASPEEPGA